MHIAEYLLNVLISHLLFSILFLTAFDDDEDDIMIVEEKDALDVFDDVAEEVIIDESNDDRGNGNDNNFNHYTEVVCISPSQFHQNIISEPESSSFKNKPESNLSVSSSKGHDNNNENGKKNNIEPIESDTSTRTTQFVSSTTTTTTTTTTAAAASAAAAAAANTNESEPIYLSDSLSCFDSDSDTQPEDLDFAIVQHKVETIRKDTDHHRPDVQSDQQSNAFDENDEMDTLNLSTDDVIIVQPDYVEPIEVDQSDSDDERFASKYAFEPFVESDSQPTSDNTIGKRDDSEHTDDGNKVMARRFGGDAAAATVTATSSLDDTTTDADDDSSEVDRRGTRSRRDNVVRKNYSIRRTYARRKLKSDTDSPVSIELNHEAKNENRSDDNELTNNGSPLHSPQVDDRLSNCTIENEMKMKLIQGSNKPLTDEIGPGPGPGTGTGTGTGTDEEYSPLNITLTKAPRTYVRRKGATSKLASSNSNLNSSVAVKIEPLNTQNEHTASSSNDTEAKPAAINTVLNPMPRKRGRPRKNPVVVENNALDNNELKLCEMTEEKVIPSSSEPLSLSNIQQSNSEQLKTEIPIQTAELNGPTEIYRAFQKSNELPSEAISNDTTAAKTSFEIDHKCEDMICTNEIKLEVSSTEISTASVQQSHENARNVMEIEMTKLVVEKTNDQTDQGDELCKTNDQIEVNAMDTDRHCTQSEPSISKFILIFHEKNEDNFLLIFLILFLFSY